MTELKLGIPSVENNFRPPPGPRQFKTKGSFTAWIFGTKIPPSRGSAGFSAAAWFISKDDGTELPTRSAIASALPDSDEKRAAVAAVRRTVETLPRCSSLTILSTTYYIVEAINGQMDDWKSNGWKHRGGKRSAWEYWDEIIRLRDESLLRLKSEHRKRDEEEQFKPLRLWAQFVARSASEDYGVKSGQKFPHRKGKPKIAAASLGAGLES